VSSAISDIASGVDSEHERPSLAVEVMSARRTGIEILVTAFCECILPE
jgi:hypothetical protein